MGTIMDIMCLGNDRTRLCGDETGCTGLGMEVQYFHLCCKGYIRIQHSPALHSTSK